MSEPAQRQVGQPINPQRVTCRTCAAVPWEGDALPLEPVELLADFADSSCPIGGDAAGCPSTTAAQQRQLEQEPQNRLARLREMLNTAADALKAARDDIRTLRQQGTVLANRVASLEQDNAALKARVGALERTLPPL